MRKRIFLKNSFASRKLNPLNKKAFVASCFVNVYGFMKIKFMAYFCSKIILHRVVAPIDSWN